MNTNRTLLLILHADYILSDKLLLCGCKRANSSSRPHVSQQCRKSETQYFPPFKLEKKWKRRILTVLIYITCPHINQSSQLWFGRWGRMIGAPTRTTWLDSREAAPPTPKTNKHTNKQTKPKTTQRVFFPGKGRCWINKQRFTKFPVFSTSVGGNPHPPCNHPWQSPGISYSRDC